MNGNAQQQRNDLPTPIRAAGFALVLTLVLLALLVLAITGLGALARVGNRMEASGRASLQAREHALLALTVALRELQRAAAPDDRVTAMAGVTGIGSGSGNSTRHWCGVWDTGGRFLGWQTSGASSDGLAQLAAGITPVDLVGNGSVGAPVTNSEHVIAGRLPIAVADASDGSLLRGSYAYVVLDEGVKISAYAPPASRIIPEPSLVLTNTAPTSAQGRLRAALDGYAGRLPSLLRYEQLVLLPAPASPLTPSARQDNFHHVTLTAWTVSGAQLQGGRINLNTTSTIVWRSLLETYNQAPGVTPIPVSSLNPRGTALAGALAATDSGKDAFQPFGSVAAFGGSELLALNLPLAVSPEEFMAAVGPLLHVRSDTFRIRLYGEAISPSEPGRVEARAWAEAMVVRTPAPVSGGGGRRLEMRSLRWLSPDEV